MMHTDRKVVEILVYFLGRFGFGAIIKSSYQILQAIFTCFWLSYPEFTTFNCGVWQYLKEFMTLQTAKHGVANGTSKLSIYCIFLVENL